MSEYRSLLHAYAAGFPDHSALYIAVGSLFFFNGFLTVFVLSNHVDPTTADMAQINIVMNTVAVIGGFFIAYPSLRPLATVAKYWRGNRGEKA